MADTDALRALAEKVVEWNNSGRARELLNSCYAADSVSVEAAAMPGAGSAASEGLDAIKAKWDWWEGNHEVHSAKAEGPFLHGDDRFGVIYEIDVTDKQSGERTQMKELAVYTARGDQIVREEFFY